MNERTCSREAATARAARLADPPPPELAEHLTACVVCAETFALARGLTTLTRIARPEDGPLPGAGQVWWRAELARRRSAGAEAERPIRVAEAVGPALVLAALVAWLAVRLPALVAAFAAAFPKGTGAGAAAFGISLALAAVVVIAGVFTLRPFLPRA